MDRGYYSIDAILAEDERVPCTFNIKAATLGFLDPGCRDEDLPERSKVELPMWLARSMATKQMVRIELPKHYSTRSREDLLAGPESVDIRERSPFFYETGTMLAKAKNDQHLHRTMRMAFSGQRFRNILDASLNSGGDDMTEFLKDLPQSERRLFRAGFHGSTEYGTYKQGGHSRIAMGKVLGGAQKSQAAAPPLAAPGAGQSS